MKNIAELCEDHPCVKIIKRNINLSIEPASVDQIDKIIQGLSHRKSTDLDNIVTKIVKTSANFIDSHLANIIKNDLFKDFFSNSSKVSSVRPVCKKNDRTGIQNYRPANILNYLNSIFSRNFFIRTHIYLQRWL